MTFRIASIHEYTRFIAIDLGSYQICGSLYRLDSGNILHEKSIHIKQNRKNFLNGTIADMQGIALSLERALHEVCEGVVDEIPDSLIIGFSPTYSIHDTITSQYIRTDIDAPITMSEIDTMIKKIEFMSLDRARKKAHFQYGIIHEDIRLVSSTLTSINIDGKSITNPIGFKGSQIRITVLNIFTLASEYNILRSIISSLKKDIISLVPMPLLFSKIGEVSDVSGQSNLYIDIGYMHTTLVFENRGEIIAIETFSFGIYMLISMLFGVFPKLSHTEIENLLHRNQSKSGEGKIRDDVCRDFFSYVIDIIISVIPSLKVNYSPRNIILSGGISNNRFLSTIFFDILSEKTRYDGNYVHLSSLIQSPQESKSPITYSLSLLAQELLHMKKDPIIRVLRYALYHYE